MNLNEYRATVQDRRCIFILQPYARTPNKPQIAARPRSGRVRGSPNEIRTRFTVPVLGPFTYIGCSVLERGSQAARTRRPRQPSDSRDRPHVKLKLILGTRPRHWCSVCIFNRNAVPTASLELDLHEHVTENVALGLQLRVSLGIFEAGNRTINLPRLPVR